MLCCLLTQGPVLPKVHLMPLWFNTGSICRIFSVIANTGEDFEVPQTEYVLGPSDNELAITFRVLEDAISERSQSFSHSASGFEIGPHSTITIIIEDNNGRLNLHVE